jgi:hypothetical protein
VTVAVAGVAGWQWLGGSGAVAVDQMWIRWEKNERNRSSIEGDMVDLVWQWLGVAVAVAVAGWQWQWQWQWGSGSGEKKMSEIGAVLREIWLF